MIVFDLKCACAHVFEAWFASGTAFDEQAAAGHIRCPLCDDTAITKAAMAPNVAPKGNRGGAGAGSKAAIQAIAKAQAKLLEGSIWVGNAFAGRARAMHAGDEAHATIHGQATLAEAKALMDEGVAVASLPLPIVPPEALN